MILSLCLSMGYCVPQLGPVPSAINNHLPQQQHQQHHLSAFPPSYPQWSAFSPVMLDPVTAQQQMMAMMQQMAMFQHHMLYPQPDGHDPSMATGTATLLPTPDVPHHVPGPLPPPGSLPPGRNVTGGGGGEGTDDPKSGLFIPPLPPDQQRVMQSPKTQKHSQAIPIVSPKQD